MKIRIICIPILLFTAGFSMAQSETDIALQLNREEEILRQMRERLIVAESQNKTRRLETELRNGLAGKPLSEVPASVVTSDLLVERTDSTNGPRYKVACLNLPVFPLLEAIAQVSGLEIELHPQAGREELMGRVTVDLKDVELTELLTIVAGTQGLGVTCTRGKISVAPLSALATANIDEVLRETAMERYQTALLNFPKSSYAAGAYLGIAHYYADMGFDETAIQALDSILSRYADSSIRGQAQLLLGDCYTKLKQYEQARSSYYKFIDNTPGAAELSSAMLKVAETWTEQQNWPQAAAVFEEVFQQWPESRDADHARLRLAECLAKQEKFDRALAELKHVESAASINPDRFRLKMLLGDCLLKLKKYGLARSYFADVIKTAPSEDLAEQAYYAIGDSFILESNPLPAIEAYSGAKRLFPDSKYQALLPLRMARAYMQLNLAENAFKQLHQLPPELLKSPEARPFLLDTAHYFFELQHFDQAVLILQQLPDRDSASDIQTLIARINLKKGDTAKALTYAQAAVALAKDDQVRTEAMCVLGDCFSATGEIELAALHYGENKQ